MRGTIRASLTGTVSLESRVDEHGVEFGRCVEQGAVEQTRR